jgi:hypothetical protein
MSHEGRFQVHGDRSVLIDSQVWQEEVPLQALKAHHYLYALENRTPRKEQGFLKAAFLKTHKLIDGVAGNGGHTPYKWSWPKPSREDQRRVDTEIIRGKAFV